MLRGRAHEETDSEWGPYMIRPQVRFVTWAAVCWLLTQSIFISFRDNKANSIIHVFLTSICRFTHLEIQFSIFNSTLSLQTYLEATHVLYSVKLIIYEGCPIISSHLTVLIMLTMPGIFLKISHICLIFS